MSRDFDNRVVFVAGAPQPRNAAMALQVCAGTTRPQADLGVSVEAGAPSVVALNELTYKVTVTNHGPDWANNVILSDLLPAGLTNVRIPAEAIRAGEQVSCPPMPRLAPGESMELFITANAPTIRSTILNRARVVSDTFDPTAGNNLSAASVDVLAGARFEAEELKMEISDPVNCEAAYTVETSFTNRGYTSQQDNAGAEFLATLPQELVGDGACEASVGSCVIASGARILQWNGSLAPGETVTLRFGVAFQTDEDDEDAGETYDFCLEAAVKFDSDNDGANDQQVDGRACSQYYCGNDNLPGTPFPARSALSDQKAGSILFYNFYTSQGANPEIENTRISITNTNTSAAAVVHLFFVSGSDCTVIDAFLCLSPGQTTSFAASDMDPDETGYLMAIAVDPQTGCPIRFNYLIGDEYVKLASGHAANLGAEAIAALTEAPVFCPPGATSVEIALDGRMYNNAPLMLAANHLASPQDGNSTMLVLNRVGGDLTRGMAPLGTVTGLMFNDVEAGYSFAIQGGCQIRQLLSNNFPRTVVRYQQVIPSGRTGWMRLQAAEEQAMLGAIINFNRNEQTIVSANNGGHNLHKLRMAPNATFIVPVHPARC